jgi:hypothetical protein
LVDGEALRSVLEAVKANDGLCGRSMIAKVLRGSRDARLLALGLDSSPGYGALSGRTLEQIGYVIDEALSLGLISMRDEGWDRGRRRQEAHFPVLTLTHRGAEVLEQKIPLSGAPQTQAPPKERARSLAMRAMVQGAYALEDWKHQRIETADFVYESPGDHVILFAMERHPGGVALLCLYRWQQRTNRVEEVESTHAGRVKDLDRWFERKLREYRRELASDR